MICEICSKPIKRGQAHSRGASGTGLWIHEECKKRPHPYCSGRFWDADLNLDEAMVSLFQARLVIENWKKGKGQGNRQEAVRLMNRAVGRIYNVLCDFWRNERDLQL